MPTSKIPILATTDDIQNPAITWRSTICFRKFRRKLAELSRMHWTSVMGGHYIAQNNAAITPSDTLAVIDTTLPFKGSMMSLNRDELSLWLINYDNVIRNSILVLCTGNLEHYLKRAILVHLLSLGHSTKPGAFKLSEVGQAIGAPVLKKSTIPAQLKYIQSLLGLDFRKHISVWEKAYKERCTLAHQAGTISSTNQEDILFYDEDVQTDWPALRQVLDSTNQIVSLIDQKISTAALRLLELEFELAILKSAKKLPSKKDLWTFVHAELRCANVDKPTKQRIETALY